MWVGLRLSDLLSYPESKIGTGLQFSAGTLADFVSGLTADPSDPARPSLSEAFNHYGVDLGLTYHDNTPKIYVEANPWNHESTFTPAEGQNGQMRRNTGDLSFGAMAGAEGATGYVQGHYSVTVGEAGWTAPQDHSYESPIYDDQGNEIGSETVEFTEDGFHSFDNATTTLGVFGYGDTDGNYHVAGLAEHERTINLAGRDFDFEGLGAIGIDSDYGGFAMASAEMRTILHGDTNTYAYGRAEGLFAQNDEHSYQSIEMGIITSVLDTVGNGALSALPPIKAGVQYDGQEMRPNLGIDIKF